MGITISYEGTLRSPECYTQLMDAARAFAATYQWPLTEIDEPRQTVPRCVTINDDGDTEAYTYTGSLRGVRIEPEPDCESLSLIFGDDLFFSGCTKTQFAGPAVHRAIVQFFAEQEGLFRSLRILDEAEYWTNRDDRTLDETFGEWDRAIQQVRVRLGRKTFGNRIADWVLRRIERS